MEEWTNFILPQRRMDCRMMRRILCFRTVVGESRRSQSHGLAYFKDGRFVAVNAVCGGQVYLITGDKAVA